MPTGRIRRQPGNSRAWPTSASLGVAVRRLKQSSICRGGMARRTLSLAIVGDERLGDHETARRAAAAIAADACAFDQQGCNSPHTVFVERGGSLAPGEFARLLGEAMAAESRRAPLEEVDPAAAMNALGVRTEYAMRGDAYHSRDIQWAVVYSDKDKG